MQLTKASFTSLNFSSGKRGYENAINKPPKLRSDVPAFVCFLGKPLKDSKKFFLQGWEYSAAMYIILNACALFFICYAYTRMLKVIKSSGLAIRSTQERQDRVVAQRFAVIVTTDCLCWIPVIIIKITALGGKNKVYLK